MHLIEIIDFNHVQLRKLVYMKGFLYLILNDSNETSDIQKAARLSGIYDL